MFELYDGVPLYLKELRKVASKTDLSIILCLHLYNIGEDVGRRKLAERTLKVARCFEPIHQEGHVQQGGDRHRTVPGRQRDYRIHQGSLPTIPKENEIAGPVKHRSIGVRGARRVKLLFIAAQSFRLYRES